MWTSYTILFSHLYQNVHFLFGLYIPKRKIFFSHTWPFGCRQLCLVGCWDQLWINISTSLSPLLFTDGLRPARFMIFFRMGVFFFLFFFFFSQCWRLFFYGQNVWIKFFIDVSLESTVFCFSDMWERESVCVCVQVGMIIVQIISAAICIHKMLLSQMWTVSNRWRYNWT